MISDTDQRDDAPFLLVYQKDVSRLHLSYIGNWPLLTGWDRTYTRFNDWEILVLRDKPFTSSTNFNGIHDPSPSVVGFNAINDTNRSAVRARLERFFGVGPRDAVILIPPDGRVGPELIAMLQRHEAAMGLGAMKIFLSHKSVDKTKVRDFKETLLSFGFDPWLDEDAMAAGVTLNRGILEGIQQSCAIVFFITPDFKDEKFIADEIDHAMAEKHTKGDKFSIITLVFEENGIKGTVPALLKRYVYKEPASDLQALREITKALPIQVGSVHWR